MIHQTYILHITNKAQLLNYFLSICVPSRPVTGPTGLVDAVHVVIIKVSMWNAARLKLKDRYNGAVDFGCLIFINVYMHMYM